MENGKSVKLTRKGKIDLRHKGNSLKHGYGTQKTREYRIWLLMRSRCNNPKHKSYHNWGGRGIRVCEEWNDFLVFLNDMGLSNGLSIDRIDNNGNYCKENCRWATTKQQSQNKRRHGNQKLNINQVREIIYKRSQGVNANELARQYSICSSTVRYIIRRDIWKTNDQIHLPIM